MGWALGVDLGTTYSAAAVLRDGQARMVNLGQRAAAIPSVVFLRDDDTMLIGEAAVRRGVAEPDRVAREFKRRVGDPAPILLGGVPMSADALLARLLAWVVDTVSEREGGPPDRIVVCHPANWGPYKLELLVQACRRAGIAETELVSEPEAAARHYASQERVETGAVVAVYDLGGGTFDAAVLRKTEAGFERLGRPEGIERLGGIDFDEAVLAHALRHVGDTVAGLGDDPPSRTALARLRRECVDAKEALSADSETSIPVTLPGLDTEVRLTRAEFESAIRVPLLETVAALRRAIRSAGVEADGLAAVLLVGGSSRIPMVAQMVGAELGRPVAVDADPKHAVALGAALTAVRPSGDLSSVAVAPTPEPLASVAVVDPVPAVVDPAPAVVDPAPTVAVGAGSPGATHEEMTDGNTTRTTHEPASPPATAAADRRGRRPLLVGAGVVALAVAAGVGAALLRSGGATTARRAAAGNASRTSVARAGASSTTVARAGASPTSVARAGASPTTVGRAGASPTSAPVPGSVRDTSGGSTTTARRSPAGGVGLAADPTPGGSPTSAPGEGGGAPTGWISPCPAGPSVCITSVDTGPAGVTARFVADQVDLAAGAGGGAAAVFFLTTVDEGGASNVDRRTGSWIAWRSGSPFQGFANQWTGSNALCVLLGDAAGEVRAGTGNCAQLPSR
ncbi:MAG: Hsp70 family protein [Acidimicrobiia bacterium]